MKIQKTRVNGLGWALFCGVSFAFAVGCSDDGDGDDASDALGGFAGDPSKGGSPTGGQKGSGGGSGGKSAGTGGSQDAPRPNWEGVVTPIAVGEDAPLQCAQLEQENCWKNTVDQGLDCAPSTTGTLSLDGKSCTFDNGSRIEFSEVVAGREGYIFAQYSLINPDDSECFTVKSDGIGDFTIQSGGDAVAYDSLSLLSYRIICEGGNALSTAEPGSCTELPQKVLDGEAPVLVTEGKRLANGTLSVEGTVGGSSVGNYVVMWSCR